VREHYDVTSAGRRRALALGAIAVDYVQMQAVLDRKALAMAADDDAIELSAVLR
jgi:hypothetical protein